MAATRVYSTAAYYVAAIVAILLGLVPKFGALIFATPGGVLGGITVVLYGMIGLLGAKIWKENRVDFANPINLVPLAAGIIIAIGNDHRSTFSDDFSLGGIALGTIVAVVGWHLARALAPAEMKARCPEGPCPRPVHARAPPRRGRRRRGDEVSEPGPDRVPRHQPIGHAHRETRSLPLRRPRHPRRGPRGPGRDDGEGAKVLAGGQSLLPLLSMRLAAPATLVDINRVPGLDTVEVTGDGVTVGALVRHTAARRRRRRPGSSRCWPGRRRTSPTRRSATGAPPSAPSRTPTPPAR